MRQLQLTLVFVLWLCLSITPALAGTVASGGGGLGGGGGGSGDASLAEQQTQTGLLTTIDADTGTIAGAVKAEDAAHVSGDTGVMSLCVRTDTAAARATTDGDYIPCTTDSTGRVWTNTELPDAAALADGTSNPTITGVAAYNMCFNGTTWDRCVKATDPCQINTKSYANINGTAGATIVTGVSAKKIYICSLVLVTATAQNINLVSGTGTVCATSTAAILGVSGGTTAATGWNLAANGGLTLGSGGFAVGSTNVNADNLCMLTSSTGQITGGISYVTQ